MNDIDEPTNTTKGDSGVAGEVMPSELPPEGVQIICDESPQRGAAESPSVDSSSPVPAQGPRRMIWKPLAIALALLIVVGAGWYVFVFMKTPAYALNQVKKAYDTHDIQLFNQYVDADAFCQQTVDDYLAVDQHELHSRCSLLIQRTMSILSSCTSFFSRVDGDSPPPFSLSGCEHLTQSVPRLS